MSVNLIGSGTSAASTTTNVQQDAVSQQQFLQILLTQLQYQDPLKPMDNQQFLAQMAQFSSLSQQSQTNTNIDTLLTIQSATQSIGLIGKTVQVAGTGGSQVGSVTSVSFSNNQPVMSVTTSSGQVLTGVSLSQITTIQ
jgi:flagellar basal-body rod modification protein FlgD